ncbi:MAG: hypothetical protein IJ383_05995 [Bacteroidales bacterium]|nr:hypothetical protein [Bacteroidales bacterium]
MTFDKVAINFGKGALTYGQTYVALSRAIGKNTCSHLKRKNIQR